MRCVVGLGSFALLALEVIAHGKQSIEPVHGALAALLAEWKEERIMWQAHFLLGWKATGSVLAMFFGGAAAVILAVMALALLLMVIAASLNAVFNLVTEAMAKHWEKVGKRPGTRWAEIIAKGRSRKNDGE